MKCDWKIILTKAKQNQFLAFNRYLHVPAQEKCLSSSNMNWMDCFMWRLVNLICTSIGISIITHIHVSITQVRLKLNTSSNGFIFDFLLNVKQSGQCSISEIHDPYIWQKKGSRKGIILGKICYDSYAWAFILDHYTLTGAVAYNKHLILTSLTKKGPV